VPAKAGIQRILKIECLALGFHRDDASKNTGNNKLKNSLEDFTENSFRPDIYKITAGFSGLDGDNVSALSV
jgi:hypothetical protein